MADRIDQLIARKSMGDVVLTPEEKKELANALYGLAPSSARYKQIISALGKPRESSYRSPGANPDGTQRKVNEPTFAGPPTLDFLSHTPDGLDGGSAARGWDAAGPVTSTQPVNDTGATTSRDKQWTSFIGGGGMAANPGLADPGLDTEEYDMSGDLVDKPLGYSFSEVSPGQLGELRNDPRVFANFLAQSKGLGANTEADYMPYIEAARVLSASGTLGNANDGGILGGPEQNSANLQAMEDMVNIMSQPGYQEFNTQGMYERTFDRALETNFDELSTNGGQPVTRDDIIEVTNKALMGVNPLITPEAASLIGAKLERAGVTYKSGVARGEITVSYPAYLESLGARDWLG